MPDLYAVRSLAAVSHGAIHFLCRSLTNIATAHLAKDPKLSYVELPLDVKRSKAPLLANSADVRELSVTVIEEGPRDVSLEAWH
jgi:hypothetical protein